MSWISIHNTGRLAGLLLSSYTAWEEGQCRSYPGNSKDVRNVPTTCQEHQIPTTAPTLEELNFLACGSVINLPWDPVTPKKVLQLSIQQVHGKMTFCMHYSREHITLKYSQDRPRNDKSDRKGCDKYMWCHRNVGANEHSGKRALRTSLRRRGSESDLEWKVPLPEEWQEEMSQRQEVGSSRNISYGSWRQKSQKIHLEK